MMATARNSLTGEPLFSPADISRLFQLVADIAWRRISGLSIITEAS